MVLDLILAMTELNSKEITETLKTLQSFKTNEWPFIVCNILLKTSNYIMALTILFNTGLNFSEGKLISSLPFQNTLIHDKLSKNNQGIELLTSYNCK